ncbi:hypothetical protein [Bacteroides caecimuris]|uniref:hypothetical protein n=1 Tax=Bacteroides caecimuris TaxID=1796613 RepID=UPI00265B239A|nr:hypothetical protein [Bacteroides caecimuris]
MGITKINTVRRVCSILSFFVIMISLQSCNTEQIVYVCTGPQAYAYHNNSDCYLMTSHCTGAIKEVTISRAKRVKRKPCGKCANE